MFHTPAHKQPASLVVSRALVAELVDHDAPQPTFRVETLRRAETVELWLVDQSTGHEGFLRSGSRADMQGELDRLKDQERDGFLRPSRR